MFHTADLTENTQTRYDIHSAHLPMCTPLEDSLHVEAYMTFGGAMNDEW
jgi:hypothetical protein